MNDERIRYKIADRAFNRRAQLLSRLGDPSEQKREIGICAAALECATNEKNWPLVEKLGLLLMKYRESQLKARKEADELVDMSKFRAYVLGPFLDAVVGRIKEALPDSYEDIIDGIEADLRRPQRLEDTCDQ